MHTAPGIGIIRGGVTMERGVGVRNPPGHSGILEPAEAPPSGAAPERTSPGWGRRIVPHHRGRRSVALLSSGVVALATTAAIILFAGGGSAALRLAHVPHRASPRRGRALAGSVHGSPAAREAAAENAAISRTLAYTPYVRIAGAQHREIALTFDDGPGPYTPEILAILERERAPATFFEVGVLERYFWASTVRIVRDHDVIGDHTELHASMPTLPVGQQRTQLLAQAAAVGRYGARFPRLFRPPYGMWNDKTLALLRRYRMLMVLWTVDTNDYRRPGVAAIVRAAIAGARPGAIILLHDAGGNRAETVAALPRIIAALRRRGYTLVTVPRLLLDNPPPRVQNIAAVIGSGG